MWTETKSKEEIRHSQRRLKVFLVCVVIVACLSVWATVTVIKGLRQAAHYTTLDLRQLQFALYIYELKSHFSGQPKFPASLEDLVTKKALSQADLDRLKAAYTIEYIPPAADASPETILFRAQRKSPAVIYTVSGQNRMETSPR